MEVKKLKKVTQKSFDDIYNKKVIKPKQAWESIFEETIKNQQFYNLSKSFWYIGDFSTSKVVAAGGDVSDCTPLSAKDWVGLNVMEIGKLFHPLDMPKMQAFTVFMADFLSKKTQKQRDSIRISMLFRLINSKKKIYLVYVAISKNGIRKSNAKICFLPCFRLQPFIRRP